MIMHETRPVLVWIDADLGIADMVEYLNTIPGLRTTASCQGTIGEGGAHPYRAQVMAEWSPDLFARLCQEFDITLFSEGWGYLHPKENPTECGVVVQEPSDMVIGDSPKLPIIGIALSIIWAIVHAVALRAVSR